MSCCSGEGFWRVRHGYDKILRVLQNAEMPQWIRQMPLCYPVKGMSTKKTPLKSFQINLNHKVCPVSNMPWDPTTFWKIMLYLSGVGNLDLYTAHTVSTVLCKQRGIWCLPSRIWHRNEPVLVVTEQLRLHTSEVGFMCENTNQHGCRPCSFYRSLFPPRLT